MYCLCIARFAAYPLGRVLKRVYYFIMETDQVQTSQNEHETYQEDVGESANTVENTEELSDEARILKFLESGEKQTKSIAAEVSKSHSYVGGLLRALTVSKKIVKIKKGWYRLSEKYSPRTEAQNAVTIDRLLNHFDRVVEVVINDDKSFEDIETLLKHCKSLSLTIDKLMHRWYLVHRGYDTNTRQAQEDAKAKTVETEQEKLKNASLEDQIVVVGHYDPRMKKLWDNLPEEEQEKRTV